MLTPIFIVLSRTFVPLSKTSLCFPEWAFNGSPTCLRGKLEWIWFPGRLAVVTWSQSPPSALCAPVLQTLLHGGMGSVRLVPIPAGPCILIPCTQSEEFAVSAWKDIFKTCYGKKLWQLIVRIPFKQPKELRLARVYNRPTMVFTCNVLA